MKVKKHIFNCCILIIFSFYSICCFVRISNLINSISDKIKTLKNVGASQIFSNEVMFSSYKLLIFYVFSLIICGYAIYKLVKTTFFKAPSYAIKYTYEEYKEKRDKQKSDKQAEDKQKKIENLKQQLNDLENTD